MRKWLIGIWLLVPLAFAAWHYGPGQVRLRADDAANSIRTAQQAASAGDWEAAIAAYDAALSQLSEDRVDDARRVRLARASAKLRGKTLAKGREELGELITELEREPNRDPEALNSARSALAYSQFHTCWLMRLEGRSRLEWEPEVEAARQGLARGKAWQRMLEAPALGRRRTKVATNPSGDFPQQNEQANWSGREARLCGRQVASLSRSGREARLCGRQVASLSRSGREARRQVASSNCEVTKSRFNENETRLDISEVSG